MLESLITSKTRIKLLLKFFVNPGSTSYLRGLSEELDESTNAVRVELNRLTKAGLLKKENQGRTILYKANTQNTLFPELHKLVKKYLGIEEVIDNIITQLGNIDLAFITGDYAKSVDSGIIDLIIVGQINDRQYLHCLVDKTEDVIKRKIRILVLSYDEYQKYKEKLGVGRALLIWGSKISFGGQNSE